MNNRPKIKPKLSTTDKIVEWVGWTSLLVMWIMAFVNYPKLPDTIAIHFNAVGKPDGFGNRAAIFGLPSISTVMYLSIFILNKYPHIFNYPTNFTAENALKHYTSATRLLRYVNVSFVVMFGLMTYQTIQLSNGKTNGLGIWFLPLTLIIPIAAVVYYIIASKSST